MDYCAAHPAALQGDTARNMTVIDCLLERLRLLLWQPHTTYNRPYDVAHRPGAVSEQTCKEQPLSRQPMPIDAPGGLLDRLYNPDGQEPVQSADSLYRHAE
jgi:hypothetical protein